MRLCENWGGLYEDCEDWGGLFEDWGGLNQDWLSYVSTGVVKQGLDAIAKKKKIIILIILIIY
jgi:hypothetical protein